jgi:hypothetical protein
MSLLRGYYMDDGPFQHDLFLRKKPEVVVPSGMAPAWTVKQEVAATNEAINQAEVNTDEAWKVRARAALLRLCETRRIWTSDDVWELGLEKPREPRALGGLVRDLVKTGIVVWSGGFDRSRQKGCHMSYTKVWRSTIYRGPSDQVGTATSKDP